MITYLVYRYQNNYNQVILAIMEFRNDIIYVQQQARSCKFPGGAEPVCFITLGEGGLSLDERSLSI